MAILRNDTTVRSADGQTTSAIITAANIGNFGIATNSTYYIGTTQNVFNRASASQTLTGVSIDGNAATVTNGVYTTGAQTIGGTKTFSDGIVVNGASSFSANVDMGTSTGSKLPGHFYTNTYDGSNVYFHIGTSTSTNKILNLRVFDSANNYATYTFNSSGTLATAGDFRAPIFYDSNNTAYYIDPASTSVLNKINLNSAGVAAIQWRAAGVGTISGGFPFYNNASYGSINIEVSDNDTGGLVIDNEGVTVYGAADNGQLFRTIDEDVYQSNSNVSASTTFWINQGLDGGGTIRGSFNATADFRAPIFYDSGDTTYYLDPANTGTALLVAGTIAYKPSVGNNVVIGNDATYGTSGTGRYVGIGFGGLSNSANKIFAHNMGEDGLYICSATSRGIYFRANGGSTDHVAITSGGSMGIGTSSPSQKLHVVGNIIVAPASSSWAEGLSFTMPTASTWGGLRWRREVANNDGNHYVGYTGLDSTDDLVFGSNNGGTQINNNIRITKAGLVGIGTIPTQKFHVSGIAYSDTDFRAPIFYDSNDTAYYCDPNGTSRLANLRVYSSFDTASSDVYANMRVIRDAAFTDGLYIGFNNAGTGTTKIFGGGASTGELTKYSNYTLEPGSFRAPIFYDSDNTAYYTDPNGTSVLNRLKIDGGNFAYDWYQSFSDFVNGTLITTDIPASAAEGESFVMEVVGKSYSTSTSPFNFSVQGYLYNSTIISYSGITLDSTGLSTIKIFENGGYLCFWWARVSYWNAFEVSVRAYNSVKSNYNRVTNITDVVEPTGTKKVTVTLQRFMRGDVSATNNVDLRERRYFMILIIQLIMQIPLVLAYSMN
jgi:hypothetical protein